MDMADTRLRFSGLVDHPRRLGSGDDLQVRLTGDVTEPARCRAVVGAWLPDGTDPDVVALVTSELVTNSVLHGSGPRHLRCSVDRGAVRIGVVDASTDPPVLRDPSPDEPTGRGLRVIDHLSSAWGVTTEDGRQEVWAIVGPPAPLHD